MTDAASNDQVRGSGGVAEGLSVPKASILRHTVFVVALLLLIATPSFLFIATVSTDSTLHGVLGHITVFGFPLWATFAVWVTLDASALYGFVGPRPDPFGPKALLLSAQGFANIATMFLFLILTNGK
ncbi:MAG: hypothetical protein DMG83_14080 [Acidobacteria bacterium]|nr:MAG: hypothetical protein DMG83_14080 [Acidobacteriota bacterium]